MLCSFVEEQFSLIGLKHFWCKDENYKLCCFVLDVCSVCLQLMTCEKKARLELEEVKQQLKKMQEAERRDRRKLAEDEALKKIKKMEESITELQKNLTAQKQVSCH